MGRKESNQTHQQNMTLPLLNIKENFHEYILL